MLAAEIANAVTPALERVIEAVTPTRSGVDFGAANYAAQRFITATM